MLKFSVPLQTSVGIHSSRRARGMMSTGSGTWLAVGVSRSWVEGSDIAMIQFHLVCWLLPFGSLDDSMTFKYGHCQTQRKAENMWHLLPKRTDGSGMRTTNSSTISSRKRAARLMTGVEFDLACRNEQMKGVEPKRKTSHNWTCYNHTYITATSFLSQLTQVTFRVLFNPMIFNVLMLLISGDASTTTLW